MRKWAWFVVVFAVAALPSLAFAEPPPGPPTLDAVGFPIDTASIGAGIATAGGVILLVVFSVTIGFRLVKALARMLTSGVTR